MSISQRIVAAYRELAETRGFHAVTMDQIASQAGHSKRTVYRYFRSKEALTSAIIDAFITETAAELERLLEAEQDFIDLMPALIKYMSRQSRFFTNPQGLKDLQQYYPQLWEQIETFRTSRAQLVLDALVNRDDSGIWRDIDPQILTTAILAAVQAVVNPDFILKNGLTFEETVNQMSRLLTQLVASPACPEKHRFAKIETRN